MILIFADSVLCDYVKLPQYISRKLGEILLRVKRDYEDVDFKVHILYEFQHLGNGIFHCSRLL